MNKSSAAHSEVYLPSLQNFLSQKQVLNELKNTAGYKAYIFDLNGTMIDDMPFHFTAWHRIITDLGAQLPIEEMQKVCYGKNHDFLERIFPCRFTYQEKDRMSYEKEKVYQHAFRPFLKLIDGLETFLPAAKTQNIKTAIGTAAMQFNVDYVLDGLDIRHLFDAVVSANDVKDSKPHPETFLRCADALFVHPQHCLVFEDSPTGVETALAAGMDCMVITTLHKPEEFRAFPNVTGFIENYYSERLSELLCRKEKV